MKKILILSISTVASGSVFSADDLLAKPQSILVLQKEDAQLELKNEQQVDFFESLKQQEQDQINQRTQDLESLYELQSNTANMSPHDRAQYYLEHRHYGALDAYGQGQQLSSLEKARNRGVISNRDYQQKIVKYSPSPIARRSDQLRLSIPIGD
ncbi:hypothetical protein ACNQO6_06855 [Acinetobacter calcoaceticus]|uniref:hypothetical protein n=1 Tax=Acinetobacter calcoaceticus TaxID=471 RepID=UPI002B2DEB4A|nr:hypothetical protein SB581_09745 [Acinetobacter baumannii]